MNLTSTNVVMTTLHGIAGDTTGAREDSHYLKQELAQYMRERKELLEWLEAASLDGVWYWDLTNPEQEWMSAKFWQTLGYEPGEKPHLASAWQNLVDPGDLARLLESVAQHCNDPKHAYDQVVRFRHKSGRSVWIRCRGVAIRNESGNAIRMLGGHTDVTAHKEAELALTQRNKALVLDNEQLASALSKLERANKELENLAMYDTLTGLGNRNLFLKQLEHLVALAARKKEEVALLVMDLDGFKAINDRLGHAAGDQVLREFAVRMKKALRHADQEYRIGGDEFAVLLEPRHGGFDGARAVADKIVRLINAPMQVKGHACSIGVSIGIAVFPDHGREPAVLVSKADAAMYEAKKRSQVIAGASELGATTVLKRLHAELGVLSGSTRGGASE